MPDWSWCDAWAAMATGPMASNRSPSSAAKRKSALEFANASSAEVYGFHKDSNGDLIVTTTNQGVDNISQSEYANFDDVLFSASGFTFSLSNGELIATI